MRGKNKMDFKPSYDNYRKIIKDIQSTGYYCDYKEAMSREHFIVVRHDVEFSMERAFQMSLVESEEGFSSTYFVQITNNSYNALSKQNIELMRDMSVRGHHIGLHYHLNGQTDYLTVRDGVRDQIRIMSEMVGLNIDRYSFHRPVKEVYYYDIRIDGIINAYSKEFFSYADSISEDTKLDVKYISDSKHKWNYGYPDVATLEKYSKIQLLIHPFSWTEEGYDNLYNFYTLINEKQDTLIQTLDDEFLRFREVRNEVESMLKI